MKIIQITPAGKQSKSGNRITADRWAGLLRGLGHQVATHVDYDGQPADAMIALHAWRSHDAIMAFKTQNPGCPLILALTGTDINAFIHSHPEPTLEAIEAADALVCLHDLVPGLVPKAQRKKLVVIYQSAPPLAAPRRPSKRHFDICVIGHLRQEKDPFRTAEAVRDLPAASRIRLIHLGRAHDESWAKQARAEMKINPRYVWKGEVPKWQVRREFAKTQLMVISSRNEGGANVVSEALVAGVPVIASDITGNVGLLGADYVGLYPLEDAGALRALLLHCETEPAFLDRLAEQGRALAPNFTPEEEQRRWGQVIGLAIG
jgi:putative glycosyltransferase (TIGR04348 family)